MQPTNHNSAKLVSPPIGGASRQINIEPIGGRDDQVASLCHSDAALGYFSFEMRLKRPGIPPVWAVQRVCDLVHRDVPKFAEVFCQELSRPWSDALDP